MYSLYFLYAVIFLVRGQVYACGRERNLIGIDFFGYGANGKHCTCNDSAHVLGMCKASGNAVEVNNGNCAFTGSGVYVYMVNVALCAQKEHTLCTRNGFFKNVARKAHIIGTYVFAADGIGMCSEVDDEDAIFYKNELYKEENIFCGISAGANLKIAIDIAKKEENKNIVIIIPDKGDRYYSIN